MQPQNRHKLAQKGMWTYSEASGSYESASRFKFPLSASFEKSRAVGYDVYLGPGTAYLAISLFRFSISLKFCDAFAHCFDIFNFCVRQYSVPKIENMPSEALLRR